MNVNAMKLSKLSRLDLLKHQNPIAAGISANVKLKLNAFSASTMHPIASNSHMVKTSLKRPQSTPVAEASPGPLFPV